MKRMDTTCKNRSTLELDYLKVVGQLHYFDCKNSNHRNTILSYLDKFGLMRTKQGSDWVLFENKDMGVRSFLSNFPMNNRSVPESPSITVEMSGHFFINRDADLVAKEIVEYFTEKFGAIFKVNRVDIRQDIYDCMNPFDYLPNWNEPDSNLFWALRGRPTFNYYSENQGLTHTGLRISTSRYNINSYNRNIYLEKFYKKGKISKSYLNYYKRLYQGRNVQRLEIQLLQDACKLFNIMFFHKKKIPTFKVLEYVIANFGRNHALKHRQKGLRIDKQPINNVFAELFYLKRKNDVKIFKTEWSKKTNLKFSEISFSVTGKSINEVIKMLAKKLGQESDGSDESLMSLYEHTIVLLKEKMHEFKEEFVDKKMACKKILETLNFPTIQLHIDGLEKCELQRRLDQKIFTNSIMT